MKNERNIFMQYMDQILFKAQTLIEALPYIQKFNNK